MIADPASGLEPAPVVRAPALRGRRSQPGGASRRRRPRLVTLFSDCTLVTSYEPGVRDAWQDVYTRAPPIVRASHVLTLASLPTMAAQVLRLATGGVLASYRLADFERGVHEAEPGADLERFEQKAGR